MIEYSQEDYENAKRLEVRFKIFKLIRFCCDISDIDNYINFVYYVKKELRNVLLNFDNTGEINIDNLKKKLNSNTSNKALKIKRKLMLEILKIKVK